MGGIISWKIYMFIHYPQVKSQVIKDELRIKSEDIFQKVRLQLERSSLVGFLAVRHTSCPLLISLIAYCSSSENSRQGSHKSLPAWSLIHSTLLMVLYTMFRCNVLLLCDSYRFYDYVCGLQIVNCRKFFNASAKSCLLLLLLLLLRLSWRSRSVTPHLLLNKIIIQRRNKKNQNVKPESCKLSVLIRSDLMILQETQFRCSLFSVSCYSVTIKHLASDAM